MNVWREVIAHLIQTARTQWAITRVHVALDSVRLALPLVVQFALVVINTFSTNLTLFLAYIFFFEDIDECNTLANPCAANRICKNTDGGYNCTCATGFSGSSCTGVILKTIGYSNQFLTIFPCRHK